MKLTKDEMETYEERMAICTIDGGLTEAEAKEIAIKQILEDRESWR